MAKKVQRKGTEAGPTAGKPLREAKLIVVIGRKGVGKTYTTLQTIDSYLTGNGGKKKPRKVLILDVNDEFTKFRGLALSDVKRWSDINKIEARRVRIFKTIEEGGGKMGLNEISEALKTILDNFHTGMLLIEDISKYVADSIGRDLIGSLCTQRHIDCDIIMHFQTIGKAGNPKILGNMDALRMHRCTDNVARHKNKYEDYYDSMLVLEALVHSRYFNGDKHFYAWLTTDDIKIKGNFTKAMFVEAVEKFLEDNYHIVKKEMNRPDMNTGQKRHKDHRACVDYLIEYYVTSYYGNPK